MQATKQPYELLVRWDQDGKLLGAHVLWRLVIRDEEGKIAGESVTGAEPVDIGGGKGFPMQDILSRAQADALAEFGNAQARVAELESQKAALENRLSSLE